MTETNRKPQLSATVEQDIYDEVADMAEKESRSLSQMVAILLEQAVKNRLRKRKNAKEV